MYYLDNSATTQVCKSACEKAIYIMRECFGNPSSLHSLGFNAEKELRQARETIAQSLNVTSAEIYFTSGGTEGANLAIFGAVEQNKRFGKRIVTSAIEHHCVLHCMNELEKRGFEVIYLTPDENGEISKRQIYDAVNSDTILVSLMAVNNETGYKLPLEAVAPAIKRAESRAIFHSDNVQSYLKEIVNVKALGIDIATVSGHKVHAPKGVGAMYLAKNKRIKPLIFGGGQEKDVRPGTENIAGICAFGVAVNDYKKNKEIKQLNDYLKEELLKIPQIKINSPKNSSPYILNFSLGKIKGETMLHFLAEKEIYVSTGSACNGSSLSHVLKAMGFEKERIESSLRISFSNENTKEDVDAFLCALKEGMNTLKSAM